MGKATKFLIGAVVLIITVLLCGVYILVTNKGRGSINKSMDSYDNMISEFDDVKFSVYADSVASGSDIISLIKNLKESDGVSIVVENKAGGTVTYTVASGTITGSDGTNTYTLAAISDKSQTKAYINSLASFDGELTRDSNGAISSVKFKQR